MVGKDDFTERGHAFTTEKPIRDMDFSEFNDVVEKLRRDAEETLPNGYRYVLIQKEKIRWPWVQDDGVAWYSFQCKFCRVEPWDEYAIRTEIEHPELGRIFGAGTVSKGGT